jgi:hypothetical protein
MEDLFNESSVDLCFSFSDRTCAAASVSGFMLKESKCHTGLALSVETSLVSASLDVVGILSETYDKKN